MSTTVALAGITGKFLQCIAKTLLTHPHVSIKGYCRNAKKLPAFVRESPRFEIIEGEFDDVAAVRKFVRGSDVVICGYFGDAELMVNGQEILVDACEEEKVLRYVASDYAVDFTKIPDGAPFPKQSCKLILDYIKTKKNVKGVHVLNGVLMETFWSPYFQLYDGATHTLSHWGDGNETWELTTFQTSADFTAAIALDLKATGVFRFLADRKSPNEMKTIFEKVYGTTLHLRSLGSLDELTSNTEAAAKAHPDDMSKWGGLGFTLYCTNGKASLGDLDNDKYPKVKIVDLEEFLKAHTLKTVHEADQALGFASS